MSNLPSRLTTFCQTHQAFNRLVDLFNNRVEIRLNADRVISPEGQINQHIHRQLFHCPSPTKGNQILPLSAEDMLSAHYLLCSLFHQYAHHTIFSKINLIGNTGEIDELSMTEYFTELSALDREKIKNDSQVFLLEKESGEIKRRKKGRSEVATNYLSTHIISESILINHQQNVVVGNPGVGKSTYARWLCHQWANLRIQSPSILVYLNLREVNFQQQYPLVGHLIEQYVPDLNVSPSSFSQLLKTFAGDFKYILDGLDELEYKNKISLEKALKRLTLQGNFPPFMLLSRPYGLKDTSFRNVRNLTEILGFNQAQRSNYVHKILRQTQFSDHSPIAFLNLIDNSVALKEISYTPLMLSYLVLLFQRDPSQPSKTFNKINGAYALQQSILEILIDYHAKDKALAEEEYLSKLSESRELSAGMELDKIFVYHSHHTNDTFKQPALLLSELGVGRYEDNRKGVRAWQFYFSSITFQEFLAAEFLGVRMTAKAFFYLFGDIFYWNFGKMLLGFLGQNHAERTINELLEYIDTEREKENFTYYHKLYYLIIAELSPPFIAAYIDEVQIRTMVEMARWANTDLVRGEDYFDAVGKIYRKLPTEQQEYFNSFLLHFCDFSIDLESKEDLKVRFPVSVVRFVSDLELYKVPRITEQLLNWLVKYYQKSDSYFVKYFTLSEQGASEEVLSQANSEAQRLLNLFDYSTADIYEALQGAQQKDLSPFKQQIVQLFKLYGSVMSNLSSSLLARTLSPEELLSFVSNELEQIHQIDFSIETEAQTESIEAWSALVVELAKTPIHREKIIDFLLALQKIVDQRGGADSEENSALLEDYQHALINLNDPQYYDQVFTHLTKQGIPNYFEIKNPPAYFEFIEGKMEALDATKNLLADLYYVLVALATTDLGRISIYKYRQQLFVNLARVINQQAHVLILMDREEVYENLPLQQQQAINQLSILFSQVELTFHFPYDRKFLVNAYYDAQFLSIDYIAFTHLPTLLEDEISISSETWVWDFIENDLIGKKQNYRKAIEILANKSLYDFQQNSSPIAKIWALILKQDTVRPFLGEDSHFAFIACYQYLRNFVLPHSATADSKVFVQLLHPSLSNPLVKDSFCSPGVFNQFDDFAGETACLYALFPITTPLPLEFPITALDQLIRERMEFASIIARELLAINNLPVANIEPYVSPFVLDLMQRYSDLDQQTNYQLDKVHFQNLLADDPSDNQVHTIKNYYSGTNFHHPTFIGGSHQFADTITVKTLGSNQLPPTEEE